MAKYEITYTEGLHINKKETIEAENIKQALVIFYQTHPNAEEVGWKREQGGDAD